jgi:lipoate-protein ligase A
MEWRLVRGEARSAAMNMALDEVAARTASEDGPATLRVYRWTPGALSLGYSQDPASVDWAACERAGVDVVRRPTGGGAIYHDNRGDISYSVAAPAAAFPDDLLDAYHALCVPVLDAFDSLGIPAALADDAAPAIHEPACYLRDIHPAHDIVVGDRKISGNAQYRRRDATVQHGSLLYAAGDERHRTLFAHPPAAAAFDGRVTTIRAEAGVDRETAVTALEDALRDWAGAEVGAWTDAELAAARELADRKYRDADWTRRGEAPTDGPD